MSTELSAAGAIIERLRGQGVSMESIGRAVGRNRSLIRQVGMGAKPGHNLTAPLEALERRLQGLDGRAANAEARAAAGNVPAPARRTTAAGRPARTRAATTVSGRTGKWSTSTVKRQGARSGGRGLLRPLDAAADAGRNVAASVSFSHRVYIQGSSGRGARVGAGMGGVVEINLGDAEEFRDYVDTEHGGSVTAAIVYRAAEAGYLGGPEDAEDAVTEVLDVELRTFGVD